MYDTFSQDYDRFVNWENRLKAEIPFLQTTILREIQKDASTITVLDAATGTGMHAIALACEGFQVCGSDLSSGMIEKARENASRQKMDVRFIKAGFGDLAAALRKPEGNYHPILTFYFAWEIPFLIWKTKQNYSQRFEISPRAWYQADC